MENKELFNISLPLIFLGFTWIFAAFYTTRRGAGKFSFMGVMTAETTRSPEAWMAAHEAIKKHLIIFGCFTFIIGVFLLLLSLRFSAEGYILIGWAVTLLNCIIFPIFIYIKATRAAKKVD